MPKDTNPQIDIHDYFNHAKKDMSPSERLSQNQPVQKAEEPVQPQQTIASSVPKEEPHPKTGDNQEIDIHEYFNFAKRGKL